MVSTPRFYEVARFLDFAAIQSMLLTQFSVVETRQVKLACSGTPRPDFGEGSRIWGLGGAMTRLRLWV